MARSRVLGANLGDMVRDARVGQDSDRLFEVLRQLSRTEQELNQEHANFHDAMIKELMRSSLFSVGVKSYQELLQMQILQSGEHDDSWEYRDDQEKLAQALKATIFLAFLRIKSDSEVRLIPEDLDHALTQATRDFEARQQEQRDTRAALKDTSDIEPKIEKYLQAFIDEAIAKTWLEYLREFSRTPLQN